MCGIAGIINSRPLYDIAEKNLLREKLQQMAQALQHRGPDGERIWVNENAVAGLAHRRLSIIDLSEKGAQPMCCTSIAGEKDRYSIVHNGEIYNYIELKKELQNKGYSFYSQTDTEVIVAAYDHWKEECLDHFDGMFAFAIWDEKEKELFAARDRFGEKPFYYHLSDHQFVFASEMKALWSIGVERTANRKMIFNFITIGYVDNPNDPGETFFEKINRLPPATFLKYNTGSGELILEKYWDINPEKQIEISDHEALQKFDELFLTSVKRRLRSDVKIGTSLSGGLDSSSIVAAIAEIQNKDQVPEKLQSVFTAFFPGFEKDESSYSKQVSNQFHLQQFTVSMSASDLLNDWGKFIYQQEEPIGSASAYAQYKVFGLAKQHGVKVLLDGQGADETLGGYHKYFKWYWQELFQKRKLYRSKELRAAKELGITEGFNFKNIIASLFPDLASMILERQYLLKAIRQDDLDPNFVRYQSKEAYYSTPPYFNLNGALYFNTITHGLEELLRYADRNSMAHGREVRLPFLSHQLVEFIFSLSSDFKIRNGWTKWLLRKTVNNKLPASISWRRDKVGFEPPQKTWMENTQFNEAVYEAKKKLIKEKILKSQCIDKPVNASNSYDADNFDWRYFTVAAII